LLITGWCGGGDGEKFVVVVVVVVVWESGLVVMYNG
jgi:hypothetical protein